MNRMIRAVAIGAAFTFTMAAMPAALHATPTPVAQDRDHDHDHVDYSRNSYYKLGNREGYQDYRRKTQRTEHNHKYRSDDDRKAHDYGYQQGWQGQRGYHPQ